MNYGQKTNSLFIMLHTCNTLHLQHYKGAGACPSASKGSSTGPNCKSESVTTERILVLGCSNFSSQWLGSKAFVTHLLGATRHPEHCNPAPLCPTEAPIEDAESHSSTRRTSLRAGNHWKSNATHFPQVLTATDTSHLKLLSLSPHTDLSQHRSFPNCSMIYN